MKRILIEQFWKIVPHTIVFYFHRNFQERFRHFHRTQIKTCNRCYRLKAFKQVSCQIEELSFEVAAEFGDGARLVTEKMVCHLAVNYTSYNERMKKLNILEQERRREYFDICLLHTIIHDTTILQANRPVLSTNRFDSRSAQLFSPKTLRTKYSAKFSHIDIIGILKKLN